ncbi:PREDICTED: putative ATP synthase subunit f, mitochondrial [Priapulus caudatus]|uniref:ATP synthase subunit f, mitochondrial n=1 Tax=Priapulus caudatus TaxID=37621 RepID=A0ABM1DUB0_PRICU|nr:PREDICTED: putative ATP synthase subunit f, mitochondrial [Priapulus caudatus]
MVFGELPKEYNPKIHGPYDPARYYGRPDIKFADVKLGELGAWFARRNKSPQAISSVIGRSWWRWQHKYWFPRKAGMAPFFQLMIGTMGVFYLLNYGSLKHHKNAKYH